MKYILNFYDTKGTLKFKREISIASMNKSFKDVDTFFFMAEDYGRIGYEEQDFDNYESDTEIYFQGTLANCKEFDRWCKKEGLYEQGLNGENYLDEETKNVILQNAEIIYENGKKIHRLSWLRTNFFERFTPKEVREMLGYSYKTAIASYICEACARNTKAERGNVVSDEYAKELIKTFAKKHDCWYENANYFFGKKYAKLSFGSEADVFLVLTDTKRDYVIKTIDVELTDLYDNLSKAFDRFIIHNVLFSETAYEIVGFGTNQFGKLLVIAKQNYIEGEYANEVEIENDLTTKINLKYFNGDYCNERYFISDIEPKNVIKNEEGLFVIDAFLEFKDNKNLGHIYYEPEEIPSGLGGFDNPTELQTQEMHLLAIKKIGDFGEKIGGSAKDRFNGRTKKEGEPKKTGFNRLPTQEERDASNGDVFFKKYKPNVSDFEALGLNKICARLAFCHYYGFYDDWAGYNKNSIEELYKFADDKGLQSHWSDFVIEYKRDLLGLSRKRFSTSNVNLYKIDFIYTILGMALEKDLGEDFDWMNVVRINKRGNKHWHTYRDWSIFQSKYDDDSKVSEETRHKVFRLEYESVENGEPVYRVMYSSTAGGYVFGKQDAFTENKRTYRFDRAKTIIIDYDNPHKGWYVLYTRYDELYIKGKEKYIEKFGEEKKEDKWRFLDKEGMVAQYRTGKDWRNGRNADTKDFLDTFGFRAVEFGESMSQKERWRHLNFAYDSFMDLAEILNIKPENISLGGSLGLCFGSRGKGGRHAPMAHYEPVKKVINLTRRMGAGSLAHEWFHAFDNQAVVTEFRNDSFATKSTSNMSSEYSSYEIYNLFRYLKDRTDNYHSGTFTFYENAYRLDRYERRNYWSQTIECCARAFEWYIKKKLDDKNQTNEYLVQIPPLSEERKDYYPYPNTERDCNLIEQAYDQIFSLVKQFDGQRGYKTIR